MKKVPIDKIGTSTVTKVAGLSILAVLAVAFFAFPLGAFAARSALKISALLASLLPPMQPLLRFL